MKERHYEEISVGDIAERATVNRATFYAHFEDKRDLAATLLGDDLHHALVASLKCGEEVSEPLVSIGAAVFEFVAKTLGACPRQANEFAPHVAPTLQATLQTFLETWLGHAPGAMEPFGRASRETVATVLSWSLYGAAMRWAQTPRRPPMERAVREVVELVRGKG